MAEAQDRYSEDRRQWAGFKLEGNGPHSSLTMMLAEVSRCLDTLPIAASRDDYRQAIVEQNILGKATEATRKESFRRLRELYGLQPEMPVFRAYRELDAADTDSRPLLSLLITCARDPLLRATMPVIIGTHEGATLGAQQFDEALDRAFPGHQKPKIRAATARHIASTWEQSGHLVGKMNKVRTRVSVRPAAVVMALILGWIEGTRGAALFGTPWCEVLDLNAAQAQALAAQAHREGLMDLRVVGAVVEVSFPRFDTLLNGGGQDEPL